MKLLNVGVNDFSRIVPGQSEWTSKSEGNSFSSVFNNLMQEVEDSQKKADNLTLQLIAGSVEDMHQVAFAMEQAQLTLQMAVQVRNKIVDAYQEIIRMQV